MPPQRIHINLTIGEPLPSPPEPPAPVEEVFIEPEPIGLPKGNIFSFKMDGSMEITFDPAISYSADNIRDAIDMSVIVGTYSDASKMGFDYTIESQGTRSIDFQVKFTDPLYIS